MQYSTKNVALIQLINETLNWCWAALIAGHFECKYTFSYDILLNNLPLSNGIAADSDITVQIKLPVKYPVNKWNVNIYKKPCNIHSHTRMEKKNGPFKANNSLDIGVLPCAPIALSICVCFLFRLRQHQFNLFNNFKNWFANMSLSSLWFVAKSGQSLPFT